MIMRKNHIDSRRQGFTLLELLTVMAIMVIMMSIAGASYYGMSRGAALRGSTANLTTALSLARQFAVNHRNTTYVKLWQDTTNANYQVYIKAGRHVGANNSTVLELENSKFGAMELNGGNVYNFTQDESGKIFSAQSTTTNGIWVMQIQATNNASSSLLSWGGSDIAAWTLRPESALTGGIAYNTSAYKKTLVFKPDGTVDNSYSIIIKESRTAATKTVTVTQFGKVSSN